MPKRRYFLYCPTAAYYYRKIFIEPKDAKCVDGILQKYAQSIEQASTKSAGSFGALLFAVVGGKLSEGINFSDSLGRYFQRSYNYILHRAVIMVGLPYPNLMSVELQERVRYIGGYKKSEKKSDFQLNDKGMRYYEALCMKAVNQSIGKYRFA